MITQENINELNKLYKDASPSEIIKKAFELNKVAVVTTNFRPYEAAILHAVSSLESKYQWFGAIQVIIHLKHIDMQKQ